MKKSLLLAAAGAAAAALVLAGCGGSDMEGMDHGGSSGTSKPSAVASGTPASGPHNDGDIAFASGMIPHHQQAVEMADMALDKASNAEVTSLAEDIKAAQDPEIAQMSGWLVGWGQPAPEGGMSGDMEGMDHGGMMSAADMDALDASTGSAFDRMWVEMMIEHHQGAVEMAQTELSDGQNADAKALAQTIISTQTAEIATLTKLLATL